MSKKELQAKIQKLENELQKKITILKARDFLIALLREQLRQIQKLSFSIGRLCDPTSRLTGTTESPESIQDLNHQIRRPTAGASTYIASNISEPGASTTMLSIGDDDNLCEDTRGVLDLEPCPSDELELIQMGGEFFSASGHGRSPKRTHQKENSNVSVLDVKNQHSEKVQERLVVTSQNKQQNPKQLASLQSRLDANSRKFSQSPETDQLKTQNTQCKRPKDKRMQAQRGPPKFPPRTSPMEAFVPPKEGHERGSSPELVLKHCSTRMSRNFSPQGSPVPQERIRLRMAELVDSSSGYSRSEGGPPNLGRRISDWSLVSLAKALPALPNHFADDSRDCSLVHLGNMHQDLSRERELKDLGEEGITDVVI